MTKNFQVGDYVWVAKFSSTKVTAPPSKERGFQDLSPDLAAPRSKYIISQMRGRHLSSR